MRAIGSVVVVLVLAILAPLPAHAATAWVLNTQPSAASYTPSATSSFNPSGPISIAHGTPGAGIWHITFRGLAPVAANRNGQVTVAGNGDAFVCRIPRMTVNGNDVVVSVVCFSKTGVPVDDFFYLLLTTK